MGIRVLAFLFFIVSPSLASSDKIRFVTYNTGLTPKVEGYATRRQEIPRKLAALQADVVCLQEVWHSQDMTQILSTATRSRKYAFSYSELHDDTLNMRQIPATESPCGTIAFTSAFMPCFISRCRHLPGQVAILTCARQQCDIMTSLTQQCITCLVLADLATAVESCLQPESTFNAVGLLLLSDLPLNNVQITRYEPDVNVLVPRAYISAEVDGVGTVVCTHTTADLGPYYFEVLHYSSWVEQNMAESRALVTHLRHVSHAVIMGDLNSSPEIPGTGVTGDLEGSLQYFHANGYDLPYTERLGICTWCRYNSIAHAHHNLVLDHILLKNLYCVAVMRIMDDDIPVTGAPLSDHYGIEVIVNKP